MQQHNKLNNNVQSKAWRTVRCLPANELGEKHKTPGFKCHGDLRQLSHGRRVSIDSSQSEKSTLLWCSRIGDRTILCCALELVGRSDARCISASADLFLGSPEPSQPSTCTV